MGLQEGFVAVQADPPLDREDALAALAQAVAQAVDGQGGLLALEGPAGAGKTTLLRVALEQGRSAGLTTLHARCSALEHPLAFGVVRQLFDPVRDGKSEEWAGSFAGAARLAGPALEESPPGIADRPWQDRSHATRHGLYWLAADLASSNPLLLAIDDVEWADHPSQRWLASLIRQLEGLPLLVVLAVDSRDPDLLPELLDAITVRLRPEPLSEEATRRLVRRRLGETATPAFCRACHEATGGSPFLLDQLLVGLADAGVALSDEGAGQVFPFGPEQMSEAVVDRLSRLPDSTVEVVRAVAVLGDGASPRHAAALAGLEQDRVEAAVEEARIAGVLAPGPALAFVHPLVQLAVSTTILPADWKLVHRRAAQLLATEGFPADRVALHLLETEPHQDPSVVDTLHAAARLAMAKGAPEVAVTYLRRALDEPPAREPLPPLLLDLGLSAMATRRREAADLLRRAVESSVDRAQRAVAALEGARALGIAGQHADAVAVCESALRVAGAGDPPTRLRLEAELIANGWASVPTMGLAHHRLSAQDSRPPTGTTADALMDANRAFALTCRAGPAADPLAYADRALNAGVLREHDSLLLGIVLLVLTWNDRLDQAQQICDDLIAAAGQQGSKQVVALVSCFRSVIAYRCGEIREAVADARFAFAFSRAAGRPEDTAWPLAFLIDALVAAGEVEPAEDALTAVFGEGALQDLPEQFGCALLLQSRGRLRAAQGRLREAVADALDAGTRFERLGVRNPMITQWRADAAQALAELGDLVPAHRLADENLEVASKTGTARALGGAFRMAGVIAGGERGLSLLQEAVGLLMPSEALLDLVRAQVDLGAALGRAGETQRARKLLREAMGSARRQGALALARRARQELRANGSRPRRLPDTGPGALTGRELRVARMAADGLTDREIAQRLFVTQRTIERDLERASTKLGVQARAEPGDLRELLSVRRSRVSGQGA